VTDKSRRCEVYHRVCWQFQFEEVRRFQRAHSQRMKLAARLANKLNCPVFINWLAHDNQSFFVVTATGDIIARL
jgi:hypothetical protein